MLKTYNDRIIGMVESDKTTKEIEDMKNILLTSNLNLNSKGINNERLNRSFENEYINHEQTLSDSSV